MMYTCFGRLFFHHAFHSQRRPLILAASVVYDGLRKSACRPLTRFAHTHRHCHTKCKAHFQSTNAKLHHHCRSKFGLPMIIPLRTYAMLLTPGYALQHKRHFHSTLTCSGVPVFAAAVALLKSSSTLGLVQTIGRVALSLFPLVWAKQKFIHFFTTFVDMEKYPHLKVRFASMSRNLRILTIALLVLPASLIGITALASSERTPLTGRWRIILLSPAEEEAISADLKGSKWYSTVTDILTQSSSDKNPPVILDSTDWRMSWVEDTLRRLERAVYVLHNNDAYRDAYEHHIKSQDKNDDSLSPIYPPPPKYPLLPRARATAWLHDLTPHSDLDHEDQIPRLIKHTHHVSPHTLLGPPYSLLVVKKEEHNAFSYGFGPDGSGGIVVYTGFLDNVLGLCEAPQTQSPSPASPSKSWMSFFSSSSSEPLSPPPTPPQPTQAQTSRLAALLAHELSHLILSHHLETLSKGTILFPSLISISVDTIRSFLYPLTFIVGPFVGDALDRALRMSFDDLAKSGEACTNMNLELEADVVSARLLALAGFDPNESIHFWEEKLDPNSKAAKLCAKGRDSHPIINERIEALKNEIDSWRVERDRQVRRLA